ncbi:hypothetical protein ASE92_04455 [Pedobacter sp. Leaf41]|uniref:DUF92 domain-containing protein n=1 Tax=Pedobacter sp. Leaf41 TaxID=1736218 RepID=UPI0007030D9B|nr:DUF92 domain-containing protein [Pedobacter sp. Leaf41]KQN38682.1 hypothetical protein ASE92_04455 [Pedobacter sp. Leaf41]
MTNSTIRLLNFEYSDILLPIIIIAGMIYSIVARKLTVPASFTGGLMACLIFMASGFVGVMMMTAFFIIGSVTTSWKRDQKRSFSDLDENKNGRTAAQVFANAGVSTIAGVIVVVYPQSAAIMLPAMAAAFASATADTLSSELGVIYGRRFYNVITLKSDQCGRDGVISLEGTLIGVMGSLVIALIYAIGFGFDINFLWIALAGTAGNLSDSILGALLERKGLIGNNVVNFCSTLAAAIIALMLLAIS